jgi:hypothetical protein
MENDNLDLSVWITRLNKARKRREVFNILDEFRPLPWTDEQRATISKLYIRLLDKVSDVQEESPLAPSPADDNQASTSPTTDNQTNDTPVWYEKM